MRVSRLLVDELRRHALTAGINSIASTTTGPVSKTIVEGDALCSASGAVAVLLTCHRFRVMALEIAAVNATLLAIFVAAYVAFQLIGREERGRLRVGVLNAANKMQDENEHWQLRVTRENAGYDYKADEIGDAMALRSTFGLLGAAQEAGFLPGPDDRVHRGRILVDLFYPISHMWPLGMTVFRDTEVAKTWASSALQVAGILQITMRLMYGQLMTLARAADEAPPDGSVVEPWYEGQSGDRPRIFVPHDAVSQLEGFRVYIDRVIESAAEVTRAARKLEIHDGLHRRRGRSEAIAFAVVIFISGVAAPLLWDGVPRWVCAGVPVAAYCAAAYRALDGPIPARLLAFGRRIRSGRPPESPYPEAPPAANGMWGAPTGEFMEDQSPPGAPQT